MESKPLQSNSAVLRRASAINSFMDFAIRRGFKAYIVPKTMLPKRINNFKAKIFNEEEITQMLTAADNFPVSKTSPTKHLQIPLMFRIQLNCGLRTSELLNLKMCDINLAENMFTLSGCKFHKNRHVPFSDAVAETLHRYLKLVSPRHENDWIFRSQLSGERHCDKQFYNYFRELLQRAGIPHGGKDGGPRAHDLRHTFAVHCLNNWVLSGVDLLVALPILSRYMGHSGIYGTQKYLQLTAEMYPEILKQLEERYGILIPSLEANA